jgi:hypothetical protein
MMMVIALTIGIWWYFILLKCKLGRVSILPCADAHARRVSSVRQALRAGRAHPSCLDGLVRRRRGVARWLR